MTESANTDGKQKPRKRKPPSTAWKPGESGNPSGRPQGSKHKATLAAEALLDGEATALARKAVEKALEGDTTALRLCLERIVPPRRDRTVPFEFPNVETAADVIAGKTAMIKAVSEGVLSPAEGQALATLLDGFLKTLEVVEFEERLARVEQQIDLQRGKQ